MAPPRRRGRAPRKRKRKADTLKPPVWTNPLKAHRFMMKVDENPALVKTMCDTYATFCDWLWEKRREIHQIGYVTDDSGTSAGWSTLARMLLLSGRIRREHDVPPMYSLIDEGDYAVLARMGLLMCTRKMCQYDATDIRMTIRLLCVKWTTRDLWLVDSLDEIRRLIEMLVYDLNMRLEELWAVTNGEETLLELVMELAHATSAIHAMLGFVRAQVLTCNNLTNDRMKLLPDAFIYGDETREQTYQRAVQRLTEEMYGEFRRNARMGTLKEELCASVQLLLSPIDTSMRARAKTGFEVPNASTARRHNISVNEYIWDMTKMGELDGEQFLDAEDWDSDNAWLVHVISFLRIAGNLVTQHTQTLQWVGSCVLFDRDAFRAVATNGFRTTPPLLFIHAFRMFVMHDGAYYRVESVAEAFFLWCCILRGVYEDRLMMGTTAQYNLKKELDAIFDICCPRTAAQEISSSDDDSDESDAELSDGARDLLAAFGLLDPHSSQQPFREGVWQPPAPPTQEATLGDVSDEEPSAAERERRERVAALYEQDGEEENVHDDDGWEESQE